MKNCITFSGVGGVFGFSLFIMGMSSVTISPCSSLKCLYLKDEILFAFLVGKYFLPGEQISHEA